MSTRILRLLGDKEKGAALERAVAAVRQGDADARVFAVEPASFRLVPGAPFAYWASESSVAAFGAFTPLESGELVVRRGINTNDDARFLRLRHEYATLSGNWANHLKGGEFKTYYSDPHVVVNWRGRGSELLAERVTTNVYKTAIVPSRDLYFLPGLTYSRRTTSNFSARVMPSECIFGDKGPAITCACTSNRSLLAILALSNSICFRLMVEVQMAAADAAARSYEVGVIQRTPVPDLSPDQQSTLASLAHRAWSIQRQLDTVTETSHAFCLPGLLQARLWGFDPAALKSELATIQTEIDERCFDLYGFSAADRQAALGQTVTPIGDEDHTEAAEDDDSDDEAEDSTEASPTDAWAAFCSWAIGVAFGRFDVRLALPGSQRPPEPEPFDPLPACSPGMLAGLDGQTARSAPAGYPLPMPADGILVDDPGHNDDLLGRMRCVFELVFGDEADVRWNEAATALDPAGQDLRTWLRRDFFAFHLKRYSKSRRKAPLFWPISTASGGYTVWLYAHRVTADTAFAIRDRFVSPAAETEALKHARLAAAAGPTPSTAQRQELEAQETLAQELRALKHDLTHLAPLLQPLFDDGIIIWSSVLWPVLGTHAPWQKALRESWTALSRGDYDWAGLAMRLWPERVVPKCQADRSLAIAHDLEDELWHQDEDEKWQPTRVGSARIQELITERQSPAVQTARDWLLARPAPASGGRSRQSSTRSPRAPSAKSPRQPRTPATPRTSAEPTVLDPALAERVLAAIAEHPAGAAKADIISATGLDDGTWNRTIAALLTDGTVTRSGEKRGTRYHLADAS